MPSSLEQRLGTLLSRVMEGDVAFDDETLEKYSRTQGWYRIRPAAVAFPRSIGDVQAIVGVCRETGASVIPRGAGTGLSGHAIGAGVVIDTMKYLRGILSLNADSCKVQPGLVLADLNTALLPSRRWFPIDPTSAPHCSIGGMIATNAAGWHGPAFGATKDHVEEVSLVLADSSIVRFGPAMEGRSVELQSAVEEFLRPAEREIRSRFPTVTKNSSGYDLPGALDGHPVDMRRLIAGSEGTLGVIVEAVLRTSLLPEHVGGAVVSAPTAVEATEILLEVLPLRPSAAEFMDHSFLRFAELPAHTRPPAGGVLLYFDFFRSTASEVRESLDRLAGVTKRHARCTTTLLAQPRERAAILSARSTASERLNLDPSNRKVSFIEDGTVPPHRLHEYVEGIASILSARGIDAALYGHAADGNIHCSPFLDIRILEHYRMIDEIASDVADLVIRLGGTLSGEHGDGFVRTPFLERLYGENVCTLFQRVKNLFDPEGMFSPGIIVGPHHASILHDIAYT